MHVVALLLPCAAMGAQTPPHISFSPNASRIYTATLKEMISICANRLDGVRVMLNE
jgi:hypothetical protein